MHGFVSAVLADKGDVVFSTGPSVTVRQAVREMNEKGVGALLVVAQGRPAGIFTERDVLRRVVDAGRDPETTKVADVMTANLLTIPLSISVDEAMGLMTQRRLRHLPVVDDGQVVGMVSIGDLMRWVALHLEDENQHLVDYITGRHPA